LHSRIESLERQLLQYQSHEPATNNCFNFQEFDNPAIEPTGLHANEASFETGDQFTDPVDDLTDLYGRLGVAEDGHLRYFGAPSYFNLLRRSQATKLTQQPLDLASRRDSSRNLIDTGLPEELQTHLLDLYWQWQNPWQYLVHKGAFREALKKGQYDEYVTPLLLHSVLALASRYSDRVELRTVAEDSNTAGERLAEQAKVILASEIENPTTSTVAALAILSLCAMALNKEALGWIYVGENNSYFLCVEKRMELIQFL
jgi:hypothetical protein